MAERVRKVVRWTISLVVLVLLLGVAAVMYVQRQAISDYFAARDYSPSLEMAELTSKLQFTALGERVFYATHPTLDASQRFNEQCAEVEHSDEGHVLGCYAHDTIHLFKVTDERLSGIVEATAAHELLHAAWARMAETERDELQTRLLALYDQLAADDPALVERMSVYQQLSPAAFANELHSVLGTEVRQLPQWLEDHYATWMYDRSIVLDYFDASHAVFEKIQARADDLQAQLTALRTSVETRSDAYDVAVNRFNADVQEFNRENDNYAFSGNEAEFWRQRNALESRAAVLNQERAEIQRDIERYEDMRQELQDLSATNAQLNEHLDSTLAPPVFPGG